LIGILKEKEERKKRGVWKTTMKVAVKEITCDEDGDWLRKIGKFRYDLWNKETVVNHSLFPDGLWIEEADYRARHWVAIDEETDDLLGVAILTFHLTLADNPDGYIWIREGWQDRIPLPAAHLCKLAVSDRARGLGIGKSLNEVRINAAKEMGAKSVLVTASEANSRLLKAFGFVDTGVRETFDNRPNFPFLAMELVF
jgi:ribosomal protein S18 acetylase RimI-like enzyme